MPNKVKNKVLVIVGPTASGKSTLAIKLAKFFPGEIISADSRQVYKDMDIGTAKPTKKEKQSIPHYLIGLKKITETFSVYEFKKLAVPKIKEVLKRKKLPILVGGTGLYIKALVDNLDLPRAKPNKRLRVKLEKELNQKGLEAMFKRLINLDPEAAYIIDPQNPRRVLRALEITLSTKTLFSQQRKIRPPLFDFIQIGLMPAKKDLKKKINKRVEKMLKAGLIQETKKLASPYLKNNKPIPEPLNAIGYREIIDYLKGKNSLTQTKEQIKRNTWLYAKRQLTWFRKDKRIIWVKNQKEALSLASHSLAQ